jgi:hypothetical protein
MGWRRSLAPIACTIGPANSAPIMQPSLAQTKLTNLWGSSQIFPLLSTVVKELAIQFPQEMRLCTPTVA